jgi:hypothetical protein
MLTRTVTERFWILTAEWPDRKPVVCRIQPPHDVDDADRRAEEFLSQGAVRVSVEPFHRRIKNGR